MVRTHALDRGVQTANLVQTIRRMAMDAGGRPAVTTMDYSHDRAGVPLTLTYSELDERARAAAAELAARCAPGTRVALLCPHDTSYVAAFLGCLYAGVVAVPLYAPEALRGADRLRAVMKDSEPQWIITSSAACGAVQDAQRRELRMPVEGIVCIDDVPRGSAARWCEPDLDPDSVAYLQYTSGSTGDPAGVRVTHRNIGAAAYQMLRDTPWCDEDAVLVSWVPYFHDLGLVTGIVMPLSAGSHAVHFSPAAFIQEPYRWLGLISQFRASWTVAPNFALDLCVRRVRAEQRARLDLTSLRAVFNGSEPVRATTWDAFLAAFQNVGLRAECHSPGYGLAEATLCVTNFLDDHAVPDVCDVDGPALAQGEVVVCDPVQAGARRLVSCGDPLHGVQVRIVDPHRCRQLPADRVGEIWVNGPNVADGYWRQPERSASIFRAVLLDETGQPCEGRWLRTGDLGFVLDGQLYVTGRIKDLIIVAGRNHHPSDVEVTAQQAHSGVRAGGVAAFSVDIDGEERVVLVVEVRLPMARAAQSELVEAARAAVADRHQLAVYEAVLVGHGAIPRTTSRKIQRGVCRDRYLRGLLPIVASGR